MGEAKKRGSFEERKAAAIAAGRIKRPLIRWRFKKGTLGWTVPKVEVTKPGRISSDMVAQQIINQSENIYD